MKKLLLFCLLTLSTWSFAQVQYTHYSKSALEQDLDFLSEKLSNIHPRFLDADAQEQWQKQVVELKKSLKDSLTQNEFYISAASLLATINDGHSGMMMPFDQRIEYSKAGGTAFPFLVEIRDFTIYNKFYCGNDSTLFEGGEQILKINGIDCKQMVQDMQKLFGGTSLASKQRAVASNFRFYTWMFYDFEGDYEMVIKNSEGQVKTMQIPGVSSQDYRRNIKRMPKVMNEQYALEIDNQSKIAVMQIKSFADLKGFCAFANKAFTDIKNNDIESLVIDVRNNAGGRSVVVDSLLNYISDKKYAQYKVVETRISHELKERYQEKYPDRMEWINQYAVNELVSQTPEEQNPIGNELRFNGDLYLLTNKTSYSAAATCAGVFKEQKLGIIIGEETGGTIGYYGDFWLMKTPNTGISFYIAPKRFIQYGGSDLNRGVIPDLIVQDNGDAILDYTFNLIKQKERN